MATITVRRTTLKAGREDEYARLHAQIPHAMWQDLTEAGVIAWDIWRDGSVLFHRIETREGLQDMIDRMAPTSTADARWREMVNETLDPSDGAEVTLTHLWHMDHLGQSLPGAQEA